MILFNGSPVEIGQFPNGESAIKKQFTQGVKNSLTLRYESDADLFQLLLIRKALWFPVDLHIPYFPYSRMDRKSDSHVFTLKSVCKFINWLEFDNVYIYEPHSDVTPALLNKCKIINLTEKLLRYTGFDNEKDAVFYPDAGAQKKYSEQIKAKHELVGFKKRDFETGRIKRLQILSDSLTEKVFIVDDLCSKGGTFILAAEELRNLGFQEVNLVVAHCEKTIFEGKIFTTDLIDFVYTTDTILSRDTKNDRLGILPVEY